MTQPEATPPKKKSHKILTFIVLPLVAIVAIVIGVQAASGGSGGEAPVAPPAAPQAPAPAEPAPVPDQPEDDGLLDVTYKITSSSGEAFVTYGSGTDGMSMVQKDVESGWSETIPMEGFLGSNPIATISVTPPMDLSAPLEQTYSLTCEVLVDGQQVDYQEASGQYASVTCSS